MCRFKLAHRCCFLAYALKDFECNFGYVLEDFSHGFAYVLENISIFATDIQLINMIYRNLIEDLRKWSRKHNRKPLVIRGARQVGKTTLVKEFSKEFDAFVLLNLERNEDRVLFERTDSPKNIIDFLRLSGRIPLNEIHDKRILLFIDEIQSCPSAIGMLRYFYEDMPEIYVIAAGSRLQELFKSGVSFPVGRVEYLSIRPCFFDEFVGAVACTQVSDKVRNATVPKFFQKMLNKLFQTYALVGGMPEVVNEYASNLEIAPLASIYSGLLQSYDEDVEKYAVSSSQISVLRHLLRNGWNYAGQTISFARFGGSSFTSTAVHQAFELLEKAFLVSLDYPTTATKQPIESAYTRSPKLIWLDSGLVNFSANIQTEYMTNKTITDVWRGHAAEQIVGQGLWEVLDRNYISSQNFWVRDKKGSNAEIDFMMQYRGALIPIEVKSGTNAHLRSLQSFMDISAPSEYAVRIWTGEFAVDDIKIIGSNKTFRLINLPFYLTGCLDKIIDQTIQ